VLGKYDDVISVTNVAVTPVVGFLGRLELSQLRPSATEISDVFFLTLEDIMNPANVHFERGSRGVYPVFRGGKDPVWGLTSFICYNFCKEILCLSLPSPKHAL